jgi:Domain of unknown function (DUF1707)
MAGRGDEVAAHAEGRGHLRASHADREQVIGVLKAAFVQGMVTKHEFDLRIGQVFASRTYAELAALTADIPAGLTPAQPLSVPKRKTDRKALKAWASVTATFTAVAAVVAAASAGNAGQNEFIVVVFVPLVAMLVGVLLAFHSWLDGRADRRSSRDLPPGGGCETSPGPLSAEVAAQLPEVSRDARHTAEARLSNNPGQPSSSRRASLRWCRRGSLTSFQHSVRVAS